jgi:UDP-N-acetylglucosamine diphosphorylase/glucosamine-1-phosphate N-acetyltransferase
MNNPAEQSAEERLFPFTLTRPVVDIRVGILTIREKWLMFTGSGKPEGIPSNVIPTKYLPGLLNNAGDVTAIPGVLYINRPWEIFQHNDVAIREDFNVLTSGRTSLAVSSTNQVINPDGIFLEEGARVECAMLNAATGPIYIGRNAEIMEGSMIRGPVALCEGAVVKMGSKIYGATTIGPYSVAGGEIKNSVIFGYSNKAHDGYLGDSVIGEWCNLGAGTSNSNLKNTAAHIKIYNPVHEPDNTPGQKCGLLMGDYSRAAINTSFNTGTVTGVCCNIFGEGLTSTYIPSFSWGGKNHGRYALDKALRDISSWKKLKNKVLTDEEVDKLTAIFHQL